MTRASATGDVLTFEDPIDRAKWTIERERGDLMFYSDEGETLTMRGSDAASIGDWLRRTFADADWRKGVDPAHTSIPIDATALGRAWTDLTDEQRLQFLERHPCCRHCGSLDTGCYCNNDE